MPARTRQATASTSPTGRAAPFLKWAGGKTQLLPRLSTLVPESFVKYFEPFLGGGALFFWLRSVHGGFPASLLDLNADLVECYQAVRDRTGGLVRALKRHKRAHSREYFYEVRGIDTSELSAVERAARLIYLNKTCYNGLYRVNSQGRFNVPMGSYKNPAILEREVLLKASLALDAVDVQVGDFSDIADVAGAGDFVYLDPPYYPISRTSSFTSYVVGPAGRLEFGAGEHQRLAEFFRYLDQKGCKVLLSNSDSDYVARLYRRYRVEKVEARRSINSNGSGRAAITELVIRNY